MQLMIVEHVEKGQGLVVDRVASITPEGTLVRLGVSYFEHPKPAVVYEDPDDLEQIDFIESVAELEEDADDDGNGEGEGEEQEEEEEPE